MSENQNNDATNVQKSSREVDTHPNVLPSDFTSTHIDRIMIAKDDVAKIITMTLLQNHIIPQYDGKEWVASQEPWQIVGELKMSTTVMDELMIYYISEITGGLNIIPIIQNYLKEHPLKKDSSNITYGPTKTTIS